MASENEKLANEILIKLEEAKTNYLINYYSAEQYLQRLRLIFKASNL